LPHAGAGSGIGGTISWRLQAWTGATLGLFAVKRGPTSESYADFDSLTVTNLD